MRIKRMYEYIYSYMYKVYIAENCSGAIHEVQRDCWCAYIITYTDDVAYILFETRSLHSTTLQSLARRVLVLGSSWRVNDLP